MNLEEDALQTAVFPDAVKLDESFYRVGDESYTSTWDMSHSKPGNGPFIVFAAWAPSVGTGRRVLLDDIPSDDGAFGTPPETLLLEPGCTSYTAIRSLAETGRFGRFRFSSPSAHVNRRFRIAVERRTYCFRQPDEPVYAISIDYRQIRWAIA